MILWQWHEGITGAGKRPKAGSVAGIGCSNPEGRSIMWKGVVETELVKNRAFKRLLRT